MTISALAFRQVSKRFGKIAVIWDFSCEVQSGECFALAGVNGAGKTTLIKCLLDLCALDSGTIDIFGVRHCETRARAQVTYLPEKFSPPYYLTGQDFLRYCAQLNGIRLVAGTVNEIASALDLDSAALSKPVRRLSKGMAQKLGLAACLFSNKQLFILDEPLSGLDPRARILVKARLKTIKASGGTIFLTSHTLSDIEELSDRMAIMHEGGLRFIGTPAALKHGYGMAELEQAFLRCVG